MTLLESFDQALRQWQMYMEENEQLDVCDITTPEANIFKECLRIFEEAERASQIKESANSAETATTNTQSAVITQIAADMEKSVERVRFSSQSICMDKVIEWSRQLRTL